MKFFYFLIFFKAFRAANLQSKDKVLIIGGAGGAGSFAIQYAKNVLDLYVITTCSEKKIEICKSLGADEVIDYNKEDYTTKLKNIDFVYGIFNLEFLTFFFRHCRRSRKNFFNFKIWRYMSFNCNST